MIQNSGNRKLRQYFEKYELNQVDDIPAKYTTKAADFYRRKNLAIVKMELFEEEEPSVEEG